MATYLTDIKCSENILDNIIQVLGYPIVDKDTIFDILPKDYIINEIVGISMETYFQYFPIVKTFQMSSNSTIDSPIENVLGILHYNFVTGNTNTDQIDLHTGNAFYTSSVTNQLISGSTYGTPFNYNGGTYTVYQQKFLSDSMKKMNGGRQYSVRFDFANKKFKSISKQSGNMNVVVGCYSNDTNDIEFKYKTKFLDLCKAELGMSFARKVLLMDADLPLQIDADTLNEDSKDLKDETIEWLERNSKFSVMA